MFPHFIADVPQDGLDAIAAWVGINLINVCVYVCVRACVCMRACVCSE